MTQVFTDAQTQEILSLMQQHFSVAQYIGARYVPIFGRKGEDSIEWDNTAPYEPLTIVLYQGNSFTSRQYVPAGVDINNSEYWASTGIYNAQIEAYRNEVLTFDNRINDNAENISDNADAITTINSDNWVTENRLANGSVTNNKIADGSISNDKISIEVWRKHARFTSPELFGAIGDGVADDTEAFKQMLLDMQDGDLCVLQSSDYLVTEPLTINVSFARFTSFCASESKPCINFRFASYNNVHCVDCFGTGNTFTNIHFKQDSRDTESYLIYIDAVNNYYNIDYVFNECVFSNCWNCFGVVGRNLHITNCLISSVSATAIVIKQPNYATALRGFVFDNNRFHIAGMIINTTEVSNYSETFNLMLVNNFIDFSKRLYIGISDNVNISGNTVAQTTYQDGYLVLFSNTVNANTCAYISNNMVNTLGSPTSAPGYGPISGLYNHTTDVKGTINISGNMFYTVYNGARGVIVCPETNNDVVLLICGNTIHTNGSGTPIQIVNDENIKGLISGNVVTTKESTNFISAVSLTVVDNFTANVTF